MQIQAGKNLIVDSVFDYQNQVYSTASKKEEKELISQDEITAMTKQLYDGFIITRFYSIFPSKIRILENMDINDDAYIFAEWCLKNTVEILITDHFVRRKLPLRPSIPE